MLLRNNKENHFLLRRRKKARKNVITVPNHATECNEGLPTDENRKTSKNR